MIFTKKLLDKKAGLEKKLEAARDSVENSALQYNNAASDVDNFRNEVVEAIEAHMADGHRSDTWMALKEHWEALDMGVLRPDVAYPKVTEFHNLPTNDAEAEADGGVEDTHESDDD